jgi:acid phosphatase type 7
MTRIILILCLALIYIEGSAQTLLRGPYLQKQTSTSMNIKWRTDAPSNSKVYYGTAINSLTSVAEDTALVTDHEVMINGLQPFTEYFYKIESNGTVLSGPDNKHRFKTAPVPGTVQPIRVWAIGDFGKGNDGERATRDSYLSYTGNTHTDVWLWLGDNAYSDGTDQEFQQKVFDTTYAFGEVFKFMHFYPCPGNHDYNSICKAPNCNLHPDNHVGPYYNIVTVPTAAEAGGVPSTREHYYSFDYGNVHFISLNSELGTIANAAFDWTGVGSGDVNNLPMMQWLKQDLQNNTQPWVVAYWHQPPYSKGSHNSDDIWEIFMKAMRKNFVPVLEQYGVDVIINGHSHVYERSYLINGHYADNSSSFNPAIHLVNGSSGNENLGEAYIKYTDGPTPNKGTVYVISGNGGSSTSNPPFATTAHPVMYFNDGGNDVYGSFIMDINDNKLNGKYLTSDGQIKDQFTIQKQSVTSVPKDYTFFNHVKNISISPNPFKDKTAIEYEMLQPGIMSVSIYSLDGKLSYKIFEGEQQAGKQRITIDAASLNLSSGKYILKLSDGSKSAHEQVIKIN